MSCCSNRDRENMSGQVIISPEGVCREDCKFINVNKLNFKLFLRH
jgi:hypothetical protein